MKTLIGALGLTCLLVANFAGAYAYADDCNPAECVPENNGTEHYAACCVPKDGDLGQSTDTSCQFKATVSAKTDGSTGPTELPGKESGDSKTTVPGQ